MYDQSNPAVATPEQAQFDADREKNTCPTCTRSVYSPYRQFDPRGKVLAGCVDECHSPHLLTISESTRWHNRPEARQIRKRLKQGQMGKGY